MSERDTSGSEREWPSPYSSGYTIEDYIELAEDEGDDPEEFIYYTTYSWVYHTAPRCPFIQDTDRLWRASSLYNLNKFPEPYITGPRDCVHDLSECNWCSLHADKEHQRDRP